MAKIKQHGSSAAHTREQVRQQRQMRQSSGRNASARNRNMRRRTPPRNTTWLLVGGVVVAIIAIVAIFYVVSQQQNNGTTQSDPAMFNTITHVNSSLLSGVGTGSANNLLQAAKDKPALLTGADGKPEFFYVGAEYCPYCAAQRWSIVVALSRFGSLSPLEQITSSEGNYPTFSFHNSTYKSQYIHFVSVETSDNQGNSFEKLTADQQQIVNKYDAPPYTNTAGSIPFISVANQLVSSGSYYDPGVLTNLSWKDIANQLKDPSTNVSKAILGSANYMTAAICTTTKDQPTDVCSTPSIQQIEKSLPKVTAHAGGLALGSIAGPLDMVVRRED